MSLYTLIMKRWAKPALERSCARAFAEDFIAGFEEARTETLMARGEDPGRARQREGQGPALGGRTLNAPEQGAAGNA
jgi:hypothetical protein